MRLLILISFTVSILADAGTQNDLDQLDQARKDQHQGTYNQLRDLNYVRMKILSIQTGTKELLDSWNSMSSMCTAEAKADDIEICASKLGALSDTARLKLNSIDALNASTHYDKLMQNSGNDSVNLPELVTSTRKALAAFSEQAQRLRRQFGVRVAAARFDKAMQDIRVGEQAARLNVACRLQAPLMQRKLLTAQLSRREASLTSDGYLLLRADGLAREVVDSADSLLTKCPQDRAEALKSVRSAAQKFLGETPAYSEMVKLGQAGCAKIKNQAVRELRQACAQSDFSPAVLYSIHRQLKSAEAK